ncbi:hypothetical protein DPMN_011620 [Dreissena polymorpha]|uniref:Uncharacterized protein n=1 Tax=Dreissena polymorpha TaxID=45954 RepID=A0A9D4N0W8_DREPO|nr:hypothetical protein DPMN_011620 [Dreissena polymorpha]
MCTHPVNCSHHVSYKCAVGSMYYTAVQLVSRAPKRKSSGVLMLDSWTYTFCLTRHVT